MRQAFVNPSDLRLVVGKGTVAKLAGTTPALAVNASFFAPDYTICSPVAQAGKVLAAPDGPYPYLAVKACKAWFGRGVPSPAACDFAAGAGPMLLTGGKKADVQPGETYGSDIVPGGETIKNHRMAVGTTADGRVCLITLDGTFGDLRAAFLAAGCTDAMNLDGGGSAQWVEKGVTVVGKGANGYIRPVVNALVAGTVLPEATPTPEKGPFPERQLLLELGREHNRPGTPLSPIGLMIHETATPDATALDEARYFASADRDASAHYFADDTEIVQIIPENEEAQGAGPTANRKFIHLEICHFADPTRFQQTWDRAVWKAASICRSHKWAAGPNVFSHKYASDTWHESTHQDPYSYFKAHGRTFQQFCDAVDAEIARQAAQPPMADPEKAQLRARVAELEGELAASEVTIAQQSATIIQERTILDGVRDLIAKYR